MGGITGPTEDWGRVERKREPKRVLLFTIARRNIVCSGGLRGVGEGLEGECWGVLFERSTYCFELAQYSNQKEGKTGRAGDVNRTIDTYYDLCLNIIKFIGFESDKSDKSDKCM